MNAEQVLDHQAILGEGALWDSRAGVLWWIDIEGQALLKYNPNTGTQEAFHLPGKPTTVIPRAAGGLILGLDKKIIGYDPTLQRIEILSEPLETSLAGRYNDGKCDPAGRFWIGTLSQKNQPDAALYCVLENFEIQTRLTGITISNGLGWHNSKMFFIDTPTQEIAVFDYDPESGQIQNQQVLAKINTGYPDGMTIDENGNIWVALYSGNAVLCIDGLSGRVIDRVDLPVPNVTSCAFGGDDLMTLYITTASSGGDFDNRRRRKPEPGSGCLFQCRPGVKGVPAYAFGSKTS
ncbi:MAG: SMP-30/gluconolactonase/LRE family protein [Verrucomicrobiota bacterium]|nr:SMP-30/gluconolactonase/LRE family protein [Verrucomicrobiota bacterium]